MRLGIASWAVPWSIGVPGYPSPPEPLTPAGLVELAARQGVTVLQIADNMPLHGFSRRELSALRALAESHGITLQTGTRTLIPEQLLRYLDISRQLGATVVRTVSHAVANMPSIAEMRKAIEPILPDFERAGVALALENNEAHRAADFAWIVQQFSSPALGICLDTANSLGGLETTGYVVETLAPFTIVLHAKDFDIKRIDTRMGFQVVGTPAGSGRVHFDFVLDTLAKHRRDPSVILEHWPPYTGTIEETVAREREWLEKSIHFLRSNRNIQ